MIEPRIERAAVDVDTAISRAHTWFRTNQFDDGFWWA